MHVHTRVQQIGHVHFESEVLNKIQDAILRTQLNNLHSLPSDCPTREKRGWMVSGATGTAWSLCVVAALTALLQGDAQVTAGEANLNLDMVAFYKK